MKEETLETFYKDNETKETAISRIRMVPDYDTDVESMGIGGVVKFIENRSLHSFYDSLNSRGTEYNKKIILSDGFVYDGVLHWGNGPYVQEGNYFLGYKTRKEAQANHKGDYQTIITYLDGVYGLIYETKCICCSQWEVKNSVWGVVSTDKDYIDPWFNEFEDISKKV